MSPHCACAALLVQEAKVDDEALALKKRKRLERDPLHQVRPPLLLPLGGLLPCHVAGILPGLLG